MLFEVPPTTCFRAVAPFSGVVWVGINDSKPGDNRGTVNVRVHRRGPNPTEWKRPGATFACECPSLMTLIEARPSLWGARCFLR